MPLFTRSFKWGSMASSANSVEGKIEKTVKETKESFLEKIKAKFGDEVKKTFKSKVMALFYQKYTS